MDPIELAVEIADIREALTELKNRFSRVRGRRSFACRLTNLGGRAVDA